MPYARDVQSRWAAPRLQKNAGLSLSFCTKDSFDLADSDNWTVTSGGHFSCVRTTGDRKIRHGVCILIQSRKRTEKRSPTSFICPTNEITISPHGHRSSQKKHDCAVQPLAMGREKKRVAEKNASILLRKLVAPLPLRPRHRASRAAQRSMVIGLGNVGSQMSGRKSNSCRCATGCGRAGKAVLRWDGSVISRISRWIAAVPLTVISRLMFKQIGPGGRSKMARSSGAVVGPVQGCGGSTVEMLLLEILLFIVELLLMGGTHGAAAASAVTTSAPPQSPEGVAPAVEAGQFLVQA